MAIELDEQLAATARVALSRFANELEKPGALLGRGHNAEALRLQHLRNTQTLMRMLRDDDHGDREGPRLPGGS